MTYLKLMTMIQNKNFRLNKVNKKQPDCGISDNAMIELQNIYNEKHHAMDNIDGWKKQSELAGLSMSCTQFVKQNYNHKYVKIVREGTNNIVPHQVHCRIREQLCSYLS